MYYIGLILVGILLVHFFKMMRLYFVLMEHKMPLLRFVLLYIRTTFINLLVPFKLGELYRIEEIARETRILQVGILSVLIDRFFDLTALLFLLLPIDIMLRGTLSVVTVAFLAIILIFAFFYAVFPASYHYLNHYMIVKKASPRTMAALKGLDIANTWFEFASELIRGRFALILIASMLGWFAEVGTLKVFACYCKKSFGLSDFAMYIKAIFLRGESSLLTSYTKLGCVILFACGVIGYIVKLVIYLKRKSKTNACI